MFRQLKTLLDKCRAILEAAKSKDIAYNKSLEESFKIYKQFVILAENKKKPELTKAVFDTYVDFMQSNMEDMPISDDWMAGVVFYPGGDDTETERCFKLNSFYELSKVVDTKGRTTMGLETAALRFFIDLAATDETTSETDFVPKMKERLSELESLLKSGRPVSGEKAVKQLSQKLSSESGLEGIGEIFKNKDLLTNMLSGVTGMLKQPEIRDKLNELAQSAGIVQPPAPLQPPPPAASSSSGATAQPTEIVAITDDM